MRLVRAHFDEDLAGCDGMRKDVQGLKKGSVLKLLSAGSMASLLVMSMGTLVAAQNVEVPLTITVNGQTQTIDLTGLAATPGLHDAQLSTMVSGQAVTLPVVEYVVNAAGTSATVVTSTAPAPLTETIPSNSASGPLESIQAKFTPTNGGTATTENVPMSDYNSANNTVTFDPPGNLPLGDYTLTMTYTFSGSPTDVVVAPTVSYTASSLAVPGGITAVNTGAVSIAANGSVGETFTVTDAAGNPIAGVPVVFSTTGSLSLGDLNATSGITNANGQITALYTDPTVGDTGTVTAQVSGNASLTAAGGTITVVQAVPANVSVNLANGGNITANEPVTVTFTVTSASNVPVPNATLAVSLGGNLAGHGSLSTGTVTTNQQGQASVTFTPSEPAPGTTVSGTIDVVAEGYPSVTGQTGTLTVVSQAPAGITADNATAALAAGGSTSVTFTVTDKSGAALPNVPVTFAVNGGLNSSDLMQTSAVTNGSGQVTATYTGDTQAGVSGDIIATTAGYPSYSASSVLTVMAGPAAQIAIGSTTSSEMVGGTYSATVTLQDQYGNPVSGNQTVEVYGSVFTPSSTQSALFGTQAQMTNDAMTQYIGSTGVPSASDLNTTTLNFVNGSATLYFTPEAVAMNDMVGVALPANSPTAAPVESVVSTTDINVSNPGATPYTVTASQSAAATVGAGATDAITFTVTSQDGNPVSGADVQFGTASSTGTLLDASFENTTGVTNGNGQVTAYFSDTRANQTGYVTAVASIGSSTASGETGLLTVVAGPAASISASMPTISDLMATEATSVTYTVLDQYGNPVPDAALGFQLEGSLAGSLMSTNGGFTNSSGQVTETYTPNPYSTTGSGQIQAQVANTGLTADSQTITFMMPAALPTSFVTAAGESQNLNQPGDTATVGSTSGIAYAGVLSDFANLSAGGATVLTPSIVSGASVTSGTAAAVTGQTLAVWPSSGTPQYYLDLTNEAPPSGATGAAYVGFQFTSTTGDAVIWYTNGQGQLLNDGNRTATDYSYVPVASGTTSGTAWTLEPSKTIDQWVMVNGTVYQFNVQQP